MSIHLDLDIIPTCVEWNLTQLTSITTDNGRNFVAAVNLLTQRREAVCQIDEGFRCSCRTLQLVVNDAILFKPIIEPQTKKVLKAFPYE